MELPERKIFLGGFGWAGFVSLLTWVVPVVSGGPLDANLLDLVFGVLILAAIGNAVYKGGRQNPSTIGVAFALFAATFATMQFFTVII
jgi:hypothetical protein